MTKQEFDNAVDILLLTFHGSLTSGRRTEAHSRAVGGFAGDPHTWGLGADVVWDTQGSGFAGMVRDRAQALGLWTIWESSHTHLQPLDFPGGPVTHYGGVTRPLPGHD